MKSNPAPQPTPIPVPTTQTPTPTTTHPPTLQLKLSDIIKLILQFLHENNLPSSFHTLQKESQVSMNIINRQVITEIIMQSNWERLFKELNYLSLSQQLLFEVYEFVVDDLIDGDRFEAAGFVVGRCVDAGMVKENKEKVLRMEYICQNPSQKPLYHTPPTPQRRQSLLSHILKQTHQQVQQSRLLKLITSALKYEASKGLITPSLSHSFSLIENKYRQVQTEMEQMITGVDKRLRFGDEAKVTALGVSNRGEFIAVGGVDGLIQIYQPIDYTLDTYNLKYQADGIMLYHQHPVQHLKFSQTDELLLSIDHKNHTKIWNTQTGRMLRKIDSQTYINCCSWGLDSSQIVVGYQNVRVYGIRGCNVLKEYVCGGGVGDGYAGQVGQEFLVEVVVGGDQGNFGGVRVFAVGRMGTVRVFNYRTQEQISVININRGITNGYGPILKVIHPSNSTGSTKLHLCTSKHILTLNDKLQQISKYELTGSGDSIQLVNIAYSSHYIYQCIKKLPTQSHSAQSQQKLPPKPQNQHVLQIRDAKTGRVVHSKGLDSGAVFMELHPVRNLLVVYGEDNVLCFWRP